MTEGCQEKILAPFFRFEIFSEWKFPARFVEKVHKKAKRYAGLYNMKMADKILQVEPLM